MNNDGGDFQNMLHRFGKPNANSQLDNDLTDMLSSFGFGKPEKPPQPVKANASQTSRNNEVGVKGGRDSFEVRFGDSSRGAPSEDAKPQKQDTWGSESAAQPSAFDVWSAGGADAEKPPAKSKPPSKKPEGPTNEEALLHFPYDIVEVKLADQQADVNSPLYSVHSFEQLGLPRNMIGQSQSGTGKTAAFVLSMLSRIDYDLGEVQAICLAPTRELARQIMDVAKEMAQFTKATLEFTIRENERAVGLIKAHIVIGTPGSLIAAIQRRRIDTTHIKMFVLDEADTMLDMQGLGDQCSRIKKFLPKDCQQVLFSATFPDAVREFAHFFAPEANEISLKQQELSIESIKQFYLDCEDNHERDSMLVDLYGLMTIGQSIIFVNTRAASERIAEFMTAEGHHVIALHGAQELTERDRLIDTFRSGKAKVMVTTNVVSRGIDISQVNLVINYDMPFDLDGKPDLETYLHRIGRTGRFGRSGVAINFVSNPQAYQAMIAMETHFGQPVAKLEMSDYEATERILRKALK
ncbi:RNA helicase required for poly(A+) mRNA export [Massospora cicadina]|nr:RNA helicase required for poly(A+) mRNA export [Massospora cicadina]